MEEPGSKKVTQYDSDEEMCTEDVLTSPLISAEVSPSGGSIHVSSTSGGSAKDISKPDSPPVAMEDSGENNMATEDLGASACKSASLLPDDRTENNLPGGSTNILSNDDPAGVPSVSNSGQSVDTVRDGMLNRLAKSDAHFKHQQRGDPDLTFKEKYEIISEILLSKPTVFLNNYSKYLIVDDIPYFSSMRKDYIIDFYMKEIEKQCDVHKSKTMVRNRRYGAMKKLMDGGSYFSDDEMKCRDPLLFEQMVGQFLTEEEHQAKIDHSDLRFSTILAAHIDNLQNRYVYHLQKELEVSQSLCTNKSAFPKGVGVKMHKP